MERTNKEDAVYEFVKTGGGTFVATILGRRKHIKPNQKFRARLSDIPEAHRDTIQLVDGRPLDQLVEADKETNIPKEVAEKAAPLEYSIEPKKGGWYDVIDSNGKKVNENSLREDAAKELVDSLKN